MASTNPLDTFSPQYKREVLTPPFRDRTLAQTVLPQLPDDFFEANPVNTSCS
jgi:hypothetical protein